MTDDLVSAIYSALGKFGEATLTTPHLLQALIAEQARASRRELAAVSACIQHGIATALWNNPHANAAELSAQLVQQAGLATPAARWAVEVWRRAIDHHRRGEAPPLPTVDQLRQHRLPPPIPSLARPIVAAVLLVTIIGTTAGALPGILGALGVRREIPQALRFRHHVQQHEPVGTRMTNNEFALWVGALGGLGGLMGAALGNAAGGFTDISIRRTFGAASGAAWAFDGAALGVAHFGLAGALFGSLFVAATVTAIGALLGRAAVVLWLKPLAWLVWPHF